MSTIEHLQNAKNTIADGIDEAIVTLKGSVEFKNAVEELLKDSPYAKPAADTYDFDGLYGRLRAALIVAPVVNDRLLAIAGLVNSYHNDGTKLTAAETLKAIAEVLGDPFASQVAAPVVRGPQEEPER